MSMQSFPATLHRQRGKPRPKKLKESPQSTESEAGLEARSGFVDSSLTFPDATPHNKEVGEKEEEENGGGGNGHDDTVKEEEILHA